jgi:hypothetical protein
MEVGKDQSSQTIATKTTKFAMTNHLGMNIKKHSTQRPANAYLSPVDYAAKTSGDLNGIFIPAWRRTF